MSSARGAAIEAVATVVEKPGLRPGTGHTWAHRRAMMPIAGAEWERIPGESDASWEGFVLYKAIDPRERTLVAVAQQQGKHINTVGKLARKYHWAVRVRAWDRHVAMNADAAEQEALVAEAREIRKKQLNVVKQQLTAAQAGKAQALRIIANIQSAPKEEAHKYARELDFAMRALDKAVALERLAVGLPTDVTQQTISLKQQLDTTLALVERVKRIIEEHLCDDCRSRVADELGRISAQERAVRARLD